MAEIYGTHEHVHRGVTYTIVVRRSHRPWPNIHEATDFTLEIYEGKESDFWRNRPYQDELFTISCRAHLLTDTLHELELNFGVYLMEGML